MTCVFCTDLATAGELVFEDPHAWVLLHPDWSVAGHAMVVSKQHVQNASDLSHDEWLHFARTQQRAEQVLLEETGAERAVLLKLGIMTPHLHIHIYPVSASMDRAAVQEIIDARVRVARDERFVDRVRKRLTVAPR